MKGLYFYKLISPYQDDITKDCKLTVNEIDSNFLNLKSGDIKTASFDEEQNIITLTRNDGEELSMNLSSMVANIEDKIDGLEANLDVVYDNIDGVIKLNFNNKEFIAEDLITKQNLSKEMVIDIYTNATLDGNGSADRPLKLSSLEKTSLFKSAKQLINKVNGEELPSPNDLKKGDRYVTLENICDYGYLYNFDAVQKINEDLKESGWRIPTKEDWDDMLNAIEPCAYRNHDSLINNNILGKVAGKLLKSQDKWEESVQASQYQRREGVKTEPNQKIGDVSGVDSFGLGILPAGYGFNYHPQHWCQFGFEGAYWTNTTLEDTDVYTKVFINSHSGVLQLGEKPYAFLSIRLVKDYNGHNHEDVETIQGVDYKTVLMPSIKAEKGATIWTAENLNIDSERYTTLAPNNNSGVTYSNRYVINDWNGFAWERKVMYDGDGIILKEGLNGETFEEYRIINGELKNVNGRIYDQISALKDVIVKEIERSENEDNLIHEELKQAALKDEEHDSAILSIKQELASLTEVDANILELIQDNKTAQDNDIAKLIDSCGLSENGEYAVIENEILKDAKNIHEALKANSEYTLKAQQESQLHIQDSSSIELELTKLQDGNHLQGSVKLAQNTSKENQIQVLEDGLFINIDVDYNNGENTIIFSVNDKQPTILQLPEHTNVEKGVYDGETKNLILSLTNGTDINIPLDKLAEEWAVNNNNTPIKLNIDKVISDTLDNGNVVYKNIIKANIEIADNIKAPFNILKVDEQDHTLKVDGLANQIMYEVQPESYITVQTAIEDANKAIENISLNYDPITNTISLVQGDKAIQSYQLNSAKFVDEIKYDANTESIIITYVGNNNEEQIINIPVKGLIEEWGISNENHTVTLTRIRKVEGVDELSADVNVSKDIHNILEVVNDGLYVGGFANKIICDNGKNLETVLGELSLKLDNVDSNTTNVNERLVELETKVNTEVIARAEEDGKLNQAIADEVIRATAKEAELAQTISDDRVVCENSITELSEFVVAEISRATTKEEEIVHSIIDEIARATTKEEELAQTIANVKQIVIDNKASCETKEAELTQSINNEIEARENALNGVMDAINAEVITRAEEDSKLNQVIGDEVIRATAKETELVQSINDEKARAETKEAELAQIITATDNALIAEIERATKTEEQISEEVSKVKLGTQNISFNYDEITNTITFVNYNGDVITKTINGVQLFDTVNYDAENEKIILSVNGENAIEIPVSSIIEEWGISNENTTVTLSKTRDVSGQDVLSANVNISEEEGNIIQNIDNKLYAKVTAENIAYGDGTVKEELESLREDVNSISDLNNELIAPTDEFIVGVTQENGKLTAINSSKIDSKQVIVSNTNLPGTTVEQVLTTLQALIGTGGGSGVINIQSTDNTLSINTDNGFFDITFNNDLENRGPITLDGGEY